MWTRPVPSSVVTKSPARTWKALAGPPSSRAKTGPAVAAADEVGAREAVEHLGPLAQHLLDQRLGEDQRLVRPTRART